jgi:hypothetical protein
MKPQLSSPARRGGPGSRCAPWLLALSLLGPGARPARADVVLEESFALAAGWNLIHLPVEPLEKDVEMALGAVDWQSLWTWLPDAARNPVAGRGGRWLGFHRGQPALVNALASFSGPASYAIRVGAPGTLRVKGTWRADRGSLRGSAFQLLGPSVAGTSPPSAGDYFSRPGVRENLGDLYELAGAAYRKVQAAEELRRGAAYWVRPARDIPEPHPLRLGAGFGGLRFDARTALQELEIDLGGAPGGGEGATVEPRRLALRPIPSADASFPADWLDLEQPDGTFAPLTAGTVIDVDPDASRVRLSLRARQEGGASPSPAQRALAIEVTGVTGSVLVGADLDPATLTGTWTGEAFLTEVERPSFHGGGYAPVETLSLSLILEVPGSGPPRLLPCIQVEGDRDARKINYRLEAALFHEVVALFGTLDPKGTSGTLVGSLGFPPDHPLNPYRHRYHPEHATGYDIARSLRLRFGATVPGQDPPPGAENPFSTVGVLSGVYEEEIVGLAQEPIRVRGTFRLHQLSGSTATPCATVGE